MKNDELLDLVNEKDEVIGTVLKIEANKDPSKIHREADITVFSDTGEVLIQQRSLKKKKYPGRWENTATGHVCAGETPFNAIKRELDEEVGIKANPIFFKKVYLERDGEARFMWMYYAIVKRNSKIKLDKDEVEKVIWIKPEKLEEFAKHNDWKVDGLSHKTIMEIYDKIIKRLLQSTLQ